jgi:hypothetical protein
MRMNNIFETFFRRGKINGIFNNWNACRHRQRHDSNGEIN